MSKISLKPTHKVIDGYYAALHNYSQLGFFNEGSVSPPFAILLESAAKQVKWNLVQQYQRNQKANRFELTERLSISGDCRMDIGKQKTARTIFAKR